MLKRRSVVGGFFSGLRSWVLPIHPEEAAVLYYILLPFVALHSREEYDNIYICIFGVYIEKVAGLRVPHTYLYSRIVT